MIDLNNTEVYNIFLLLQRSNTDLQQNRIESLDQLCLALSIDYVLLKIT